MGLFDSLQNAGGVTGLFSSVNQGMTPFTQQNQQALMNAGLSLLSGGGFKGAAQGFMAGSQADREAREQQLVNQMRRQQFQNQQTQFQQAQEDRQQERGTRNQTQEFFGKIYAGTELENAPVALQMADYTAKRTAKSPSAFAEKVQMIQAANPGMSAADAIKMAQSPSTVINMPGQSTIGTVPQGYSAIQDENDPSGYRMYPIPGGPEDKTQASAEKSSQLESATRVITTAAQRAREAAENRNFGSFGQGLVQYNPYTDSAEVMRQTEVLKSAAKIENLNAMRRASPTGGALGSVTEKESEMLAAKSGALDPSSPNYLRDLADYELTLLEVIHGTQQGRKIFEESRQGSGTGQGSMDVNALIDKYGG